MLTLEEAKGYLRIDFEDDDVFIEKLIKASERYIKNTVSDYESNELVDIVQLLLIQHWYYNRSIIGKIPKNFAHGIDAILFQENYKVKEKSTDESG